MSSVALPADKRFRRAHVKPARRRGPWRALAIGTTRYAVMAGLTALTLHQAVDTVAHARLLQVDQIAVQGNQRMTAGDVQAVLSGLRGENLIWLDLDSWRARLLSSPWVLDASLRRRLPSTVEVTVVERRPVATARLNGDLYLIDDQGVVIDQLGPQYAELDLPIVDGLSTAGGIDQERAALAGRVMAALQPQPEIAQRVSQLDVRDRHNVSVILSGDPAVVMIGEDRFLERLRGYIDLSAALKERIPDIDYVDFRFEDRIYVRPRKGR